MSTEKGDTRAFKRASIMSYIMAIGNFATVAIALAVVFVVILPYSTLSLPDMSMTLETFITILWVVVLVTPFSILIQALFGYYNVKVSKFHENGSLRLSGISSIILSLAGIPLIIGIYEYTAIIQTLLASPPDNIFLLLITLFLGIGIGLAVLTIFVIISLILSLIFGLIFLVTFIMGLSNLKQQTGISDFKIAMWLTILGIFVGLTLPIGIIFYGRGLSKLAKGEKMGK